MGIWPWMYILQKCIAPSYTWTSHFELRGVVRQKLNIHSFSTGFPSPNPAIDSHMLMVLRGSKCCGPIHLMIRNTANFISNDLKIWQGSRIISLEATNQKYWDAILQICHLPKKLPLPKSHLYRLASFAGHTTTLKSCPKIQPFWRKRGNLKEFQIFNNFGGTAVFPNPPKRGTLPKVCK